MVYNYVSTVVFDFERDKTLIQKSLTKLAVLPECKCPWMLCLALQPRQKVTNFDFQSEFSI